LTCVLASAGQVESTCRREWSNRSNSAPETSCKSRDLIYTTHPPVPPLPPYHSTSILPQPLPNRLPAVGIAPSKKANRGSPKVIHLTHRNTQASDMSALWVSPGPSDSARQDRMLDVTFFFPSLSFFCLMYVLDTHPSLSASGRVAMLLEGCQRRARIRPSPKTPPIPARYRNARPTPPRIRMPARRS